MTLSLVNSSQVSDQPGDKPEESRDWGRHGDTGETWGHDTFMCGLDFLTLVLR